MSDQEIYISPEEFSYVSYSGDKDILAISGAARNNITVEHPDAAEAIGARYDHLVRAMLREYDYDVEMIDLCIREIADAEADSLLATGIPTQLYGTVTEKQFDRRMDEGQFYFNVLGGVLYRYMDYAVIIGDEEHLGARYFFWRLAISHAERFAKEFGGPASREQREKFERIVASIRTEADPDGLISIDDLMMMLMQQVSKEGDE